MLGLLAGLGGLAQGAQDYQTNAIKQQSELYLQLMRAQALREAAQKQQLQTFLGNQLGAAFRQEGAPLGAEPTVPQPPPATGNVAAPNYSPGAVQQQPLAPLLPTIPSLTEALQGPIDNVPRPSSSAGGFLVGGRAGMERPSANIGISPSLERAADTGTRAEFERGVRPAGAPPLDVIQDQERKVASGELATTLAPVGVAQAALRDLPPDTREQSSKIAIQAAGALPPALAGKAPAPLIARLVNQIAGSDAPDDIKGAALLELMPLMSTEAQKQFSDQMQVLNYNERRRHDVAMETKGEGEKGTDWEVKETATGGMLRVNRRTGEVAQVGVTPGTLPIKAGASGEELSAGKNYEITNKETGQVRQVFGKEMKGKSGLVDAMTNQPVPFDSAKEVITEVRPGGSRGGRAAQQASRQLIAGGEVAADLQNIGNMPMTASTGYFGGLVGEKGGISLLDAAKINMANVLTDEDDTNMKIALGGLGRELSTLMSPVYGGRWASDQLEPMIPKKGYSIDSALYGIARIKQSALVALKGFMASDTPSRAEKEQAVQWMNEINKDIPWSVADVIAYRRQKDPTMTFGEFAAKSGLQGSAIPAAIPKVDAQGNEIGR